MAKQKILTIPISIASGLAANTRRDFSRKLNADSNFKKCRGFGLAISSYGGVPFQATLEPIAGKPLIDPVHYKVTEISNSVRPDERFMTVDFDINGSDVVIGIIANILTTADITAEAVFLLTEN
ncbi:MAG: hypothetical protein K9H61_02300 [Bacteroidia bacterium]|nr:hypothetical protein [Bacteroidia bacterium]MCF8445802.1 hypothetical protein [Bacteroidia bacterium]